MKHAAGQYRSRKFQSLSSYAVLTLALFCVGLVACSGPRVMVDRVLVMNTTAGQITDVSIKHEPTNKYGAASLILPQKTFDIGLSKQPMLAQKALVRWKDENGQQREKSLPLPYDRDAAKSKQSMNLVYVIQPYGDITVHLYPSENRTEP